MKLRVAITGAGGFLGTALAQRLVQAGAEVHGLARRPGALPGVHWHHYDLSEPAALPAVLDRVDAIVHAAFSMGPSSPELETRNREAALRLLAAARQHQVHFIFISSMSAHDGAVSSYGRAKWQIERALDPAIDTIVRPGLIIGPGGVYARMVAALRRAPILPLFYGGNQPVQPIGLDDLAGGLEQIIRLKMPGIFNLGLPEPIAIRMLYERILNAAHLRRPMIRLPGDSMVLVLRGCERLGLRLPLTAENLLGQKHLQTFPTAASLTRLKLELTPLDKLPWAVAPLQP